MTRLAPCKNKLMKRRPEMDDLKTAEAGEKKEWRTPVAERLDVAANTQNFIWSGNDGNGPSTNNS